ncbi:hypothetical protein BLA60_12105 [Actinophytocola xinjiangensis]|uniref:Beta-lactamase-related domain-containing protein n=1 Tax=Actinophytocola xinjiangensis TaxID=485602 RepID=A0A7Z1B0A3_9PSEU|nr:serine hydrolase domain-containing protein [Actinophytocola xinjiangensis]OLF11669.1 hypothetical protein BLA60_12105 [Actinophytocola xinjiangensis]
MVSYLVAVLLAVAPLAPGTPGGTPGDVERFLTERRVATEVPGLSYVLTDRERIVARNAWGVDGNGRPMTPRTPVGFGSVAKSVTALGILRLVDAGTIGLDDPVIDHLPWLRLADQDHARRITVRHLLHQTSGLPADEGYARADRDDNDPGALRRWVDSLADVEPEAAPGERHRYNPANAAILGALAEEVTGLTFARFLDREVFTPLDLADAIADARTAEVSLPPGHEYYFGTVRPAPWRFDDSGVPYGYLAGSVTDLAHLARPLLGGGEFLSPALRAELSRGGPRALGGRYGLGWRVGTLSGTDTEIVWHAGAVAGYHTVVIAAPERDLAVAVQQNAWSPLVDEQLNAAAFGALTIALGGTPAPVDESSTQVAVLAGVGALVAALAGAVGLGGWRLVRRRRRSWPVAVAWGGVGAVCAVGAGVVLPAVVGLSLRQILRFTPDLGQLAVAVVVLGSALALVRLARLCLP